MLEPEDIMGVAGRSHIISMHDGQQITLNINYGGYNLLKLFYHGTLLEASQHDLLKYAFHAVTANFGHV